LTPDELDHLEVCSDCFETWAECIAEAGRRLREHPEDDEGMVDDGGTYS
jgi:hypothetical protein